MKALSIVEKKNFRLHTINEPTLSEGEVLIKVAYSGICGTDLSILSGKNPRVEYPLTMGHEMSGEIVKIHEGYEGNLRIGDFVTVNPLIYCGGCTSCINGFRNLCNKFALYGIDLNGSF